MSSAYFLFEMFLVVLVDGDGVGRAFVELERVRKNGFILFLFEPRDPSIWIQMPVDKNCPTGTLISRNIWNILFLNRRTLFQ